MTLPSFLPMLASPIDVVPEDSNFIAETKWNGWRALGIVSNGEVVLRTRSGNDILSVPYLTEAVGELLPGGSVIDGEIIDPTAIDGGWNRVQSICSAGTEHLPDADDPALRMVVFDLLFLEGVDVRSKPWETRRAALEALMEATPAALCISEVFEPTQEKLEALLADGMEGMMVKRRNAPYVGGRSGAWGKLKPKSDQSAEAEIIGFTEGRGDFAGQVGAIRYRLPSGVEGKCSGFDRAQRAAFSADRAAFIGQVVEVAHWGQTVSGALLHPQFARIRKDRSVRELMDPASTPVIPAAPTSSKAKRPRTAKTAATKGRMRNYKSMALPKLNAAVESLRDKSGDAYDRCINGGSGDPEADLKVAEAALAAKLSFS